MTQTLTEQWNEEIENSQTDVSVNDLDDAVKEYLDARSEYEAKKQQSNDANAVMKEKMRQLERLMQEAGKSSWETEEGKASVVHKLQYPTPKSTEQKQAFAKWIQDYYGKEVFWNTFGVNSQTLNSFVREEMEANPGMTIPGLEEPTDNATIRFTKKRRKA